MKRKIKRVLIFSMVLFYKIYKKMFNNKIINRRVIINNYYKSELIIEINPCMVTHYLPVGKAIGNTYFKVNQKKIICGGKWKDSIKLIEEHRKTQDMYELYKANGEFKRIKAYKRHIFELKNNQLNTKNEPPSEVLDTKYKIDQYYIDNFKLFNVIKNEGFKSQYKEGKDLSSEIGIAIDKDGTIYRYGNGYHRMAIAKYLELSKIPVVVRLIHKDFYNFCKEKHNGDPIRSVLHEVDCTLK